MAAQDTSHPDNLSPYGRKQLQSDAQEDSMHYKKSLRREFPSAPIEAVRLKLPGAKLNAAKHEAHSLL